MNTTDITESKINLKDPAIQSMFGLLSASLNKSTEVFSLNLELWPQIKEELDMQAVLPLVSVVKMNPMLPEHEKKDLLIKTALNVKFFHKLMQAQTAVVSLLNANSIAAAVMKGASAAQYYEKPDLRTYGDIDIIVLPDDFKKAFDLLCKAGYKNLQAYNAPYSRHIGFTTPNGMKIELHRYFSSSYNKRENIKLDGWLYENIRNAERIKLNKYEVPVFPALENGLILLGHINQHLANGLGLRQIIDWMLYVRSELSDDFWKEKFRDRAEAIGMDILAKTVTKMCQKYLGLNTEITWCNDADEKLADELMLYILNNGNFGLKIPVDNRRAVFIARQMLNPVKLFRYLTMVGIIHMAEAGLKPRKSIAWLYQIGHLFSEYIHSNHKIEIIKGITCSSQKTDLMKKLHVTSI